jgi:primosomal protein N'
VLDEEHEPAYKQQQSPFYHARQLAEVRAAAEGAVLLLGSATPSLETFYRRETFQLLHLPERIGGTPLPEVELIDMRQQPRLAFSQPLLGRHSGDGRPRAAGHSVSEPSRICADAALPRVWACAEV